MRLSQPTPCGLIADAGQPHAVGRTRRKTDFSDENLQAIQWFLQLGEFARTFPCI